MLKFSNKQDKLRSMFYRNEIQTRVSKAIKPILAKIDSEETLGYLYNLTNKRNKYCSYTRARSICILTGRSRSVYRFFRLSRLKIREYANNGYFCGISKASW